MPRPCTICHASNRLDIDVALLSDASYRTLAVRFDVSPSALSRHARTHLRPQIAASVDAPDAQGLAGSIVEPLTTFIRQRRINELAAAASMRDHAIRDIERLEALLEASVAANNGPAALAVLRTKWIIAERAGLVGDLDRPLRDAPQVEPPSDRIMAFCDRFQQLMEDARKSPGGVERQRRIARRNAALAVLDADDDYRNLENGKSGGIGDDA